MIAYDKHPDLESFEENFDRGLEGKNQGIPMGFKRLSSVVGLRRKVYYLIGGYTGSAKTTLLDDAFVLNPADWFLNHKDETDIDIKILYFSMERSKDLKIAKWISRYIFMKHGIVISMGEILSWSKKLGQELHGYVDQAKQYINEILHDVVILHEHPRSPSDVLNIVKKFAYERGKDVLVEKILRNGTKFNKTVYTPYNPNELILVLTDHIGLVSRGVEDGKSLGPKETIDKYSENMRYVRDYFGYSPVIVSQFNREIASPLRIKNGDAEPMLEDFKQSASTQEDAEIVMSLFDPMRYKCADPSGFDLTRLRDDRGRKKYRSLKVLKNSYGPDDVRIPLALQPEVGYFKELPKLEEMKEEIYRQVLDDKYFLY